MGLRDHLKKQLREGLQGAARGLAGGLQVRHTVKFSVNEKLKKLLALTAHSIQEVVFALIAKELGKSLVLNDEVIWNSPLLAHPAEKRVAHAIFVMEQG